MADLEQTETQEPVEQTDGPKQLREALKRKDEQIAEMKAKLRGVAFKDAGLDPTKGIGKAVAALYDGDLDGDAIREYASTEFDWSPTGEQMPSESEETLARDRADQVMRQGTSVSPPELADQIAEAEQAGNYKQSVALKLQSLGQ